MLQILCLDNLSAGCNYKTTNDEIIITDIFFSESTVQNNHWHASNQINIFLI